MAAKKAFTKGEEVTVLNTWDNKGTVSFTHAVVYSCGTKQMVLTDATTGNEIGRHFKPVRSNGESLPVNASNGWELTFSRLSDEGATRICLELGASIVAYEIEQGEKCLSRHSDHEGYCNAIKRDMEQLHEPRAINRTGAK